MTQIVLQVELAKQVTVGEQQRDALIRLLVGSDMSIEEIVDAGRKVVRRATYGNIAFEHWVKREAEVTVSTVKQDCSYCGTEWWGSPGTRCPTCFPLKETL